MQHNTVNSHSWCKFTIEQFLSEIAITLKPLMSLPSCWLNIVANQWAPWSFGYNYTRKNAQVVIGLQTSCYKSAHKLSTSSVRTACSQLLQQVWNKLLTSLMTLSDLLSHDITRMLQGFNNIVISWLYWTCCNNFAPNPRCLVASFRTWQ